MRQLLTSIVLLLVSNSVWSQSAPSLPVLADIGGTTDYTRVIGSGDFTLQVSGTAGTPITFPTSDMTKTVSYTPTATGDVRFAKSAGTIHVYEFGTGGLPEYKGTVAETSLTVTPWSENLLANPSFDNPVGELIGSSITETYFPSPWFSDRAAESGGGVRIHITGDDGASSYVLSWRGSNDNHMFYQQNNINVTNKNLYKVTVNEVFGNNANALFLLGLGNTRSSLSYGSTTMRLGSEQAGIHEAVFAGIGNGTNAFFTLSNGSSSFASGKTGNDPFFQADYIYLQEGPSILGYFSGISAGQLLDGTAYAPKTSASTTPLAAGDNALADLNETGNEYYLYNVGSKTFLNTGSIWWTHATGMKNEALKVHFLNGNNNDNTTTDIEKTQYIYLGNGTHLSNGGFTDEVVKFDWIAETVDAAAGTFKLKTYKDEAYQYLYKESGSNVQVNVGADPGTDNAVWQVLTQADVESMIEYASETNPVNVFWYLKNPNFTVNTDNWTITGNGGNTLRNGLGTVNAFSGDNFRGEVGANPLIESWHSNSFDVYSELTGLLEGKYRLKVQGYYIGTGDTQLYGNMDHTALQTYSGTLDNSQTTSREFNDGLYENTLDFTVGSDGTARIGVRKTVASADDWALFDNFELHYLGFTNIQELRDDLQKYIDDATRINNEVGGNTTLTDAIAAAQNVVDNGMDYEAADYEAQKAALKAAVAVALPQAAQPVDITFFFVQNPSFEVDQAETQNPTGWTINGGLSSDTWVRLNSNATYTTAGVDGDYLFNTHWQGKPLTQGITGLPDGNYKVSALITSGNVDADGHIYLLGGDKKEVFTIAQGNASQFYDRSVKFTVSGTDNATIGIVGGNNDGSYNAEGYWWYKADNFRLYYMSLIDTKALEEAIAEAYNFTGNDLSSITGLEGYVTDGEAQVANPTSQAEIDALTENILALLKSNVTANKYTGTTPVANGTYYLYNVAMDGFMDGGNDWGTRTSLCDVGIEVTLEQDANGNFALSTTSEYTDKYIYLGNGITWVDGTAEQAAQTHFQFAPVAGLTNVYTIGIPMVNSGAPLALEGNYLVADPTSTVVNFTTNNAGVNGYWMLVPKSERISRIGTGGDYNNASFLIADHDFSRNTNDAWSDPSTESTYVAKQDPSSHNQFVEQFNTTFNVSQDVATVPAGLYRVEAQAFYRNGAWSGGNETFGGAYPEDKANYYNSGTRRHRGDEELYAQLYATVSGTEFKVPIRSMFGDSIDMPGGKQLAAEQLAAIQANRTPGLMTNTNNFIADYGAIPNNIDQASLFFNNGVYGDNALYVNVPADGTVTLGFKKEQGTTDDWAIFDHVRIYRVGDAQADVAEAINRYQTIKARGVRFIANDYDLFPERDPQYFEDNTSEQEGGFPDTKAFKHGLTQKLIANGSAYETLLATLNNGGSVTAASIDALSNQLEVEIERYYAKYALAEFWYFYQCMSNLANQNATKNPAATEEAYNASHLYFNSSSNLSNIKVQATNLVSAIQADLDNANVTLEQLQNDLKILYGDNWKEWDMWGDNTTKYDGEDVELDNTFDYNRSYENPNDPSVDATITTGLEDWLRPIILDYVELADPTENNVFDLTALFIKPGLRGIELWSAPDNYGWQTDVNIEGKNGGRPVGKIDGSNSNNFNVHGQNQSLFGDPTARPTFIERYVNSGQMYMDGGWALYQTLQLTQGRYRFDGFAFATEAEAGSGAADNAYLTVEAYDAANENPLTGTGEMIAQHQLISPILVENSTIFNVTSDNSDMNFRFGIKTAEPDGANDARWTGIYNIHLYKIPTATIRQNWTYIPGRVPETGEANTTSTSNRYFDIAEEADVFMYRTFPDYMQTYSESWEGLPIVKNGDRLGLDDTDANYESNLAAFNEKYDNWWSTVCLPLDINYDEFTFIFGNNAVVNWFDSSEISYYGDDTDDPGSDGAIVTLNFIDPIAEGLVSKTETAPVIRANEPCLVMIGVDPTDLPWKDGSTLKGKHFDKTNITDKRVETLQLSVTPTEAAEKSLYYLQTANLVPLTRSMLTRGVSGWKGLITADPAGVKFTPDGGEFSFIGVYSGNGPRGIDEPNAMNSSSVTYGSDPSDLSDRNQDTAEKLFYIPEPTNNGDGTWSASYYISSGNGTNSDKYSHFKYVGPDVKQQMYGLRGYFKYTGTSKAVAMGKIRMNVMNGTTTEVLSLNADGTMTKVDANAKGIYNLNGQLISRDADDVNKLPKGVYIVNGKKVAVR